MLVRWQRSRSPRASAGDGARELKFDQAKIAFVVNPCRPVASSRVLAVIPGDGGGASFIFARRQVESLRALGMQVDVHFFDSRQSFMGVLRNWRRIRTLARRCRPDLIHVHYGTVSGFVTAFSTREPLVITFRGSDLQGEPGLGNLRVWIGTLLSQLASLRANVVICVSERLRQRVWWHRDRTVVLPSGVNLDRFKPGNNIEARNALGWDYDESVVLFNAGKAPLTKGLDLAQVAVAKAICTVGPIRLEVMKGDLPPEKVPVLMNAADCLLVTSRSEGSPGVVKEALACNLPIVSVDVGDVADRLIGVTPSYIVARDPAHIAKALIDVISCKRRSNGRERVAELSETRIAERLCSIYNTVLCNA